MIYTCLIDPDFISDIDINIQVNIYREIFHQVKILDKDDRLKDEYIKKASLNPLKRTKLEQFFFPKNSINNNLFVKNEINVDCEYKYNFVGFIKDLIKKDIEINYIIINSKSHGKLIKEYGYGSSQLRNVILVDELNYTDTELYQNIDNSSSEDISIEHDHEKIISLLKYSDEIELFLYQFGKQIVIKNLDDSPQYKDKNFSRLKTIGINLEPTKTDSITGCVKRYKEELSTYFYMSIDNYILHNELHKTGDEFLTHCMTIKFFVECFMQSIKLSPILKKNRKIVIYIKSIDDDKDDTINTIHKEIYEDIISEYFSHIKNLEIEIKFMKRTRHADKKELQSHLRHLLTKQKVFNLNCTSIYVNDYKQKPLKDSGDIWLNSLKYKFKEVDFIQYPEHRGYSNNNQKDSKFQKFMDKRMHFISKDNLVV